MKDLRVLQKGNRVLVKDSEGLYVRVLTSGCHKDDLEIHEAIYMVDGAEVETEELNYIREKYFNELLHTNLSNAEVAAGY